MTTTKVWIINGANGELQPGFYKARMVRNGPFVPVRIEAIEDRDPESGELMSDVVYIVDVNGERVTDWVRRFPQGLIGDAITEADYWMLDAARRRAVAGRHYDPAAEPRQPIDLLRAPIPF